MDNSRGVRTLYPPVACGFRSLCYTLARHTRRYPAAEFNAVRAELDPRNILSNDIVDALFPRHDLPPPPGGSASSGSDLLPEEAVAANA